MVNQSESILIPWVNYFFLGKIARQIVLQEKVTSDKSKK